VWLRKKNANECWKNSNQFSQHLSSNTDQWTDMNPILPCKEELRCANMSTGNQNGLGRAGDLSSCRCRYSSGHSSTPPLCFIHPPSQQTTRDFFPWRKITSGWSPSDTRLESRLRIHRSVIPPFYTPSKRGASLSPETSSKFSLRTEYTR